MDPAAPPPAPEVGPDGKPVAAKVEHPVLSRVSHVLLLKTETDPTQSFTAGTSLDMLLGGGGGRGFGAPEGGPMGEMPGPMQPGPMQPGAPPGAQAGGSV